MTRFNFLSVGGRGKGDRERLEHGPRIVRVGTRYFRPAEVESLLGDASNTRQKSGWKPDWKPETSFSEFVRGWARLISRLPGIPRSVITVDQKNQRFP